MKIWKKKKFYLFHLILHGRLLLAPRLGKTSIVISLIKEINKKDSLE